MNWQWPICIIGAYLVGSIPFGVIIGRIRGIDVRDHGSKNIGATNVSRVLGKKLGMLCFLLDVAKGAGPTIVAGFMIGKVAEAEPEPREMWLWMAVELKQSEMWLWMAVAISAVLGHMFSIFLRFRGGKGVATGFGSLAAMWPLMTFPAFVAVVVWYFSLRMTKYVAVASMLAAISLPLVYLLTSIPNDGRDIARILMHASPPCIVTGVLAILIVYQHRSNIARIQRGEEPKVAGRKRRGDILHDQTETTGSTGDHPNDQS
ncbi:MAG: glycerol-3-phosphate 1-O-acyltransferase PlsY [Planctomycetes bacterium]|nr:glycerol-3-phosphate 1-O-acyltransferase PlsY [Planctomycetota bacterium]